MSPWRPPGRTSPRVGRLCKNLTKPKRYLARAVLYHERALQADKLGEREMAQAARLQESGTPPRTAWECYALGRSFLQEGDTKTAALQFSALSSSSRTAFGRISFEALPAIGWDVIWMRARHLRCAPLLRRQPLGATIIAGWHSRRLTVRTSRGLISTRPLISIPSLRMRQFSGIGSTHPLRAIQNSRWS